MKKGWIAIALSMSCVARTVDVDPFDPVDDDGSGTVTDDGDDVPTPPCPMSTLPPDVPFEIVVGVAADIDEITGLCDNEVSPEVAFAWTPPFDGVYVVQTIGSTFDPVISIRDATCDGVEIVCNDDVFDRESLVQVDARAGQPLVILLSAFGADVGTTTLRITALGSSCPDGDLGSTVPQLLAGDSTVAPDRAASTCGGLGSPEQLFTFTAPEAGTYAFGTIQASFDPVVYLHDGACTFAELVCDEDVSGARAAAVGHELFAGQVVTIGIDAAAGVGGPYTLAIDRLATELCPQLLLSPTTPVFASGETFRGFNTSASACGGWLAPDWTYAWVAPESGTYRATLTADYAWVLSVFDGSCTGPLRGCRNVFDSTADTGSIVFEARAAQLFVVAVDGMLDAAGGFALEIDRYEACDATALPSDLAVVVQGSTANAQANHAGSCAPTDDAPEVVYQYTAPASGSYRIDTVGSSYDTVLYVRRDDCLGAEVACSDDEDRALTSAVVVDLVAGDPIWVFVDGYGGDAGPYRLSITAL